MPFVRAGAGAFIQKVIFVVFVYTSQFMRISHSLLISSSSIFFLIENNYFKWKKEKHFDPTYLIIQGSCI